MIQIEEGFSEPDPLWRDDDRETDERMQVRARRAFDRVFSPGGADETCEFSSSRRDRADAF